MNDPHVEALHYSLRHAEYVDYDKAAPLSHETAGFTVRIENDRAEVTMKSHHATVETARAEVEPCFRAWELMAALQSRPGEFEFIYNRASIVDRDPTPIAPNDAVPLTDDIPLLVDLRKPHVERSKYPDPPPAGIACDAAVERMFDRFRRYRGGGTTLADAANFCLTVLETAAGGRSAAARHYSISKPALNKLGDLAATKGGSEARKAKGAQAELTADERRWLQEAIKRLIWRAAEVAGNPSTALPQITMPDLPPLP